MTDIAILWDASQLWGLLVWWAAEAFRLPYRLVRAEEIAAGTLTARTSVLIVPGGTARHKSAALRETGRQAIRNWVREGGHYLGFCGGAGLGLSDSGPEERARGLGLCPWHRAEITERMQHLVSGHVRVRVQSGHPLAPEALARQVLPSALPVWWPGRFAMPPHRVTPGLTVLGRYAGADLRTCLPDLCVADLPLASLSRSVLEQWQDMYGVSLIPDFLDGQPCVLHGQWGRGSYTLSYSHLETPDSPEANLWLAHMLTVLTGTAPFVRHIPAWKPGEAPIAWDEPGLTSARDGMAELLALGREHGLFFARTPWLTGWRASVPGAGLNNLYTALCVLTALPPSEKSLCLWKASSIRFASAFMVFRQGVEGLLLAQRLASTVPEAVPRVLLEEQKRALFGSAMEGGGLYRELMDILDALLFVHLVNRHHPGKD